MTFVHVDIRQVTHTCPAEARPHVVDTRRDIVAIVKGGPCRTPVTVHLNGTTFTVACGRRLPAERQCPACRITVIERHITTTHQGTTCPRHPLYGIAV